MPHARSLAPTLAAALLAGALPVSFNTVAQDKPMVTHKVISPADFVKAANPRPGERQRIEILQPGAEGTRHLAGIVASIPPGTPGQQPQYHYHQNRESIIQILAGDATEMVDGKAVPLKAGDVIYIAPGTRHTLMNNSTTQEVKYMEFYSPVVPDVVQVRD